MRRAAKVDSNQARIVAALRSIGCSVQTMHGVGEGVPDLLVGTHGLNILIEVKDGKKSPSKRKLTGPQVDWISDWRGSVKVVENVEQAIAVVNSTVACLTNSEGLIMAPRSSHDKPLLTMEQPHSINGDVWYFETFISHSGASEGQHIHVDEVRKRLEAQAGPGELVQQKGRWFWKLAIR